jgi:hypothetical protein
VVKVAEDFTPVPVVAPQTAVAMLKPLQGAGPKALAEAVRDHIPEVVDRMMRIVRGANDALAFEVGQELLSRFGGLPVKVIAHAGDLTPVREPERLTFSAYRKRMEISMPRLFKRPLNDADREAIDKMMDKLQPGLQADGQTFLVDDTLDQ